MSLRTRGGTSAVPKMRLRTRARRKSARSAALRKMALLLGKFASMASAIAACVLGESTVVASLERAPGNPGDAGVDFLAGVEPWARLSCSSAEPASQLWGCGPGLHGLALVPLADELCSCIM